MAMNLQALMGAFAGGGSQGGGDAQGNAYYAALLKQAQTDEERKYKQHWTDQWGNTAQQMYGTPGEDTGLVNSPNISEQTRNGLLMAAAAAAARNPLAVDSSFTAFENSQEAFARGGVPSENMREYELAQRDPGYAQWASYQRQGNMPAALQIASDLARARGRGIPNEQDILEAAKITTPERAHSVEQAGEFGKQEAQETVKYMAALPKQVLQYDEILGNTNRMLNNVNHLRQLMAENPRLTTGGAATLLRHIPETDAEAWQTSLISLQSALALETLMQMKMNSPTGASGLGALSEGELLVLKSAVANFQQANTQEELLRNFAIIEDKLTKMQNEVAVKRVQDVQWYNSKKDVLPHLYRPLAPIQEEPAQPVPALTPEPAPTAAQQFQQNRQQMNQPTEQGGIPLPAPTIPNVNSQGEWQEGPNGVRYRVRAQP